MATGCQPEPGPGTRWKGLWQINPACPTAPQQGPSRATHLPPGAGESSWTASWNITPNSSTLLWDLPPLVWRPPPREKPVLSAHNPMMFARISPVRIPRLRLKFPLQLPSLQVPGNRSWNSIPILKTEVRAEEEPEEPIEVDNQVETQGQEEKKGGPCSNGGAASTSRPLETQGNLASLDCSPRALKGNVPSGSLTETNSTDKVQVPAVSFHSKGHGMSSAHSPAGGVLPFGKPDPAPAVLPGPVPGCSHWPEKAASQVLGKDHLPSSSGLQMRGRRPSARILQLFSTQSCQPQFPTTKMVRATPAAATGPSLTMEVRER
ncbi:putative UPF0607 protein ENSP00000332738 [Aotus nancymaae]|uniref:putative UPF0607 protein ENSP00000332738 n=1 Tax=Aotus nancymaae TaxID=37293 RepID=UPI0030FEDF61